MAKKKHKKKSGCDLPPEGLWIDPTGEYFPVTEHLLALRQRPDLFGLSDDTKRADIPQLREFAVALIESGWTRFRYLDGTWLFEVDNAKRKMLLIEDVLSHCNAYGEERVTISQISPKVESEGTVDDVYDRTILRFQSNPKKNKWRLS